MKRYIGILLAMSLLLTCIFTQVPTVQAAAAKDESRAIAIVFDNSGSMYDNGDQAWCRATYATEVFASMLNKGDVLSIYPMNPIKVGETEYTMDEPFRITDAEQASSIRNIFTEAAGDTHIESIDRAVSGLQAAKADKKYLIVLSDGDVFYRNRVELGAYESKRQLDACFQEYACEEMTMMYLGIGTSVIMPDTPESDFFTKKKAQNSEDVLDALTAMCNQVFGRDILPDNRFNGKTFNFDVSMSKLIVFVQGENIADLKVTDSSGKTVGQLTDTRQTSYSTTGCGAYTCSSDTTLQGMMVTYENCPAGTYTIQHTGAATSIAVYYEPDAELDLLFTDVSGKTVDYTRLYEGTYKVSFGIKDAKTGKMLSSDLLGNPEYHGTYYINGEPFPIEHEGYSGEIPVELNVDDSFDARLTVIYLSGYTNTKTASDFGWPEGGIRIAAHPAGELKLEITGGDPMYSLEDLIEGAPFTAKVFYDGEQLTGEELSTVKLKWDSQTSNAEIFQNFEDDHFDLFLNHKDLNAPENTLCGPCTVTIYAEYAAKGGSTATAEDTLTYTINDDFIPMQVDLYATEDYILISNLDKSEPLVAELRFGGNKLSDRDFAAVELEVDAGGLNYELIPNEKDSNILIKLLETKGAAEDDYLITATAHYTDHIGRVTQSQDAAKLTLSHTALWLKWLIALLLLLLLIILIWTILHIKMLPKKFFTSRKICRMTVDGEDVTHATTFTPSINGKQVKVQSGYAAKNYGVKMNVVPGKGSFLYKAQKNRSAEVLVPSVSKFGPANIQEAMIGSVRYQADEHGKLVPAIPGQKPFPLKNGTTVRYSGTVNDAGIDKDFEATIKINFKNKK